MPQTDAGRVASVRRYVDEGLIYLACAYWKEKALERDLSDDVVKQMPPYAHVLALLDADDDIETNEALQARQSVIERYLTDARRGRIGWSPEGGISDRR